MIKLFFLFLVYSFLGWFIEVISSIIHLKKLVNRGFLIGPICPIYGFGAIAITIILSAFIKNPATTAVMSMIICATLEYITSYLLEKIYNLRWWDYSKYKYNLNGRICLNYTLFFAFAGLMIIYIINPLVISIYNIFPINITNIIALALFILLILDYIISLKIISGVKVLSLESNKDSTPEISNYVKEELRNRNFLYRRLVNAFPELKPNLDRIEKDIERRRKNLEKKLVKFEEKIEENNKKSKEKYSEKIKIIKTKLNKLKKG